MDFLQVLSFILIYIVLPLSGIALLVFISLLVKQMTTSIKNMDRITNDIEYKLTLLNEPIETVLNINEYVKNAGNVFNNVSNVFKTMSRKKSKQREEE